MTATDEFLRVERRGPVLRVFMNRPDVHNALNPGLIAALTAVFSGLATAAPEGAERVRVVVLGGVGPSFSAGADLGVMRAAADATRAENEEDAGRLAAMLDAVEACPLPLVARVQGAALGGAMGLLALCDIVVAAEDATFGFTEARLGIAPAVISPYVFRAIGVRQAGALFLTGERFPSSRAFHIGLVHHTVAASGLDAALDTVVKNVLQCGPDALIACKRLTRDVPALTPDDARAYTVAMLAALRDGAEGREGLGAFLEKRRPSFSAPLPA